MTYDGGQYKGLSTGNEITRRYEATTGLPVDGSDAGVRTPNSGSVFTLRVLPPEQLVTSLQEGRAPNIQLLDGAIESSSRLSKERQKNFLRKTLLPGLSEEKVQQAGELIASNGVMFREASPGRADTTAISDLDQASSVLSQLGEILRAPPLSLLIHPRSLRITHSKKQNYSDRTRFGYVRQAWGEEQIKLSLEGKIGAFISGAFFQTGKSSGVQWASKRDSPAFQNLMDLLTLYKHGGYIYDVLGKSLAHLWIGAIVIEYDQWAYFGHLENMNYGYDEAAPNGGMNFSVEYVAHSALDLGDPVYTVSPQPSPGPNLQNPIFGYSRSPLGSPFARATRSKEDSPLASDALFQ